MKTLLTMLAVVLCFAIYGQNPTFVSECNSWYHTRHYTGWNGGAPANNHHTYFFNGDTLVNGVSYKKLYLDRKDTTFTSTPTIINSVTLQRLMRQDGDTVFFRFLPLGQEYVYTIFNLSIGDTLTYFPHDVNSNSQTITVIGMDSVLFGTQYLTKYNLSNTYDLIEGIGITHGILKDFSLGIEGGIYMDCFLRNGQSAGISIFGSNLYDCNATLHGCTDAQACNYKEWADVDNGNCIYGPCPEGFDIDNDGFVSTSDLLTVIMEIGCIGSACASDFNYDGIVNTEDLLIFIQAFGSCPCEG